MTLNPKDVKIETMRGQGAGGQHKNKTSSCVRVTHKPTGLSVIIDGRKQGQNKKKALCVLQERLDALEADRKATAKKAKRDEAIKSEGYIRTYDFKKGIVTDHRTKKTATIKQVLLKGRFDLLNPTVQDA